MNVFLVGGAVRDKLMGKPVNDHDWVVVGSTPSEMLSLGFSQVGKDFPVFLHPETGEEYALARKERKVADGYTGFECDFDPSVTLDEDLFRRDLTINAIAFDTNTNKYIDPYGGMDDLKNGVLRAVSSHFSEDPLRVLRVARFASRYGYTIEENTFKMMQSLVHSDEFATLSDERLFAEFKKAMSEDHAYRFVEVINELGGVTDVFGIDQPDVDVFVSRIKVLKGFTGTFEEKMLVLVAGLDSANQFVEKFKLPSHMKQMLDKYAQATKVFEDNQVVDQLTSPHVERVSNYVLAKSFAKVLRVFDVMRRREMFDMFLTVVVAHVPSLGGFVKSYLADLADFVVKQVRGVVIPDGMQGKDIKVLMDKAFDDAVFSFVCGGE